MFLFIFFILFSSAFAQDLLVEVRVSGGFIGVRDEIKVFDDGSLILKRKDKNFFTKIDKETLNKLKSLVNDLDQIQVEGSYRPQKPIYDGYTYEIIYKNRSVTIQEPFENVPEILLSLLSYIKLVRDYALEAQGKTEFKKAFELESIKSYPEAVRARILNDGSMIYYYEKRRPPTDEEKVYRKEEFEKQWKQLESKAPEVQTEVQNAGESAGASFPSFAGWLFSSLIQKALKKGYVKGKEWFVDQPVVEEAGFIFEFMEKVKKIPVNLHDLYGNQSWKRVPVEARIFASKDGRFVALILEKGGILLWEIKNGEPLILSRISDGIPPAGFSSDGRYFYYTALDKKEKIESFFVVKLDENKIVSVIVPPPKLENITDRLIVKDYFIVLGWKGLLIYNVNTGEIIMEFPKVKNGGRSMVEMSDEKLLIANMHFGLTELDLKTFTIKDHGLDRVKLKQFGILFQKLVSVDPTGRYVAALYEPHLVSQEAGTERSRLFIWDLIGHKKVFTMDKDLDTINGGFGGYTPPAQITDDWRYLLVHGKEGGVYLYRINF